MLSELTCVTTQSCELIVWVGPVRVWADVFAMTPELPSSVAHDIYRVADSGILGLFGQQCSW
jgi:hypothetical protein